MTLTVPASCWSIDDTDEVLDTLTATLRRPGLEPRVRALVSARIDAVLDWRLDLAAGEAAELAYRWAASYPGDQPPPWPQSPLGVSS